MGLKMLWVEVIPCGISWSELESLWVINKTATQFSGPHFWFWDFHSVTHFYGSTFVMTFFFSRISKINTKTSMEYLQRHFLNHLAQFFFLQQTTDRQMGLLFQVLSYLATVLAQKFFLNIPKIKSATYYIQNIHPSPVSQ